MKEFAIDALLIKPQERPKKVYMLNDVNAFKTLVSPDLVYPWDIEFTRLEKNVVFFRNEEGALLGMKGNRRIGDEIIAGDMYITGFDDDGNICSLPKEKIEKYRKRFWKIEHYTDREVADAYWNVWFSIAEDPFIE